MIPSLSLRVGQTCIIPSHLAASTQPIALIIDDSEDCRQIAVYVLEQLGCRCLTAPTAVEGLRVAIASAPDIILLDAVLPDFSGLELLDQFKQYEQSALATVVAVTALSSAIDRQQLLDAGCAHCLSKPYLLEDLANILCPYLALIPLQPSQTGHFAPYSMALSEPE
ncbi:MAG: response regulator [Cyanobacteria bacterium P01_A01_bin.17]